MCQQCKPTFLFRVFCHTTIECSNSSAGPWISDRAVRQSAAAYRRSDQSKSVSQRILQPGEIESLDHTAIPRLRLPHRETVFADRAARLRRLAENHPISGYLRLMATLVEAQHGVLSVFSARMPSTDSVNHAQAHSMPVASALGARDPAWRDVLSVLAARIDASGAVTPLLGDLLDALHAMNDAELDSAAGAAISLRVGEADPGLAPFVMAALQVVWTDIACRLDRRDVPFLDTPGLCPVCGSMPVASIVRIGGQFQGYRFLQCSLCSTEWHMVRVKCSHCDSTKGIAYHGIDGDGEHEVHQALKAIKAESCDACGIYRKIGYQDKDYDIEPLADDLASLALDLMMSEAGYRRASPNPLLWPHSAGGE